MTLPLSHEFDSPVHASPALTCEGEYLVGHSKLLLWLERQLGLKK